MKKDDKKSVELYAHNNDRDERVISFSYCTE